MGGTGVFYTFRRAVFHEAQRATTTACPLACGWRARTRRSASSTSALRVARARRSSGTQGEGRLAALDLDRPRPRHEPVDQVAGTDLQVAPLVDGVAMRGRAGSAPGAWRRRRAGRCRRPPAGAAGPASRGRAAARRAGRRARGRPRPRSARAPRRGARTPRAPAACAIRSSPPRRRAPAGPNARRWRRTTSSSALSPLGAPRGRGAASRALGRLRAPGAVGRHAHEGRPALERAPLELALALELGRSRAPWDGRRATPRRRRRSPRRCAASGARRPAASSAAARPRRRARRPCGASGGPPPRPRPPRRPGARARRRGAASRAAACRRRALRPAAPRRGRSGSKPSTRDHSAAGGAGQYCACRAPTASTASTSGRSRRSSSPWRASSARLSAVVVMRCAAVAHARHLTTRSG